MANLREKKWFPWALGGLIFFLCLASRIYLVYCYPVDGPGDGVIYTQLAKNVLEQNVFSLESAPPFSPTLIRLPGYPLFVAAVYSVFGHDNNMAVRIVQAMFDSATCLILALIAWLWTTDEERKWKGMLWTFFLAACCPFIAIYAATLLTETMTTFLMAAMTLTVTIAFKAVSKIISLLWWSVTGLLAGMAVLLRPDSGLFALGIGLTLVISVMFENATNGTSFFDSGREALWKGGVFSLSFLAVLMPWTIRNERVFAVFQPLAPAHAEMPGEFVPHGYDRWLRTWVDDARFVEPMLWNLDEKPILVSKIPEQSFDSADEQAMVAALLGQYNHPQGYEHQFDSTDSESNDNASAESASEEDDSEEQTDTDAQSSDEQTADTGDENVSPLNGDVPEDALDDEDKKFVVEMTPEIDAQFAQIADERIAHAPFRYYLFLPAKRAAALWFDSHSLYYPFGGQMSPIRDLDYDVNQQYWLPVFTLLMWFYTLLGVGGAIVLWRARSDTSNLQWLVLAALMTIPRIVFFSTVENPEPRYVVELFAFTVILGGLFLGGSKWKLPRQDVEDNGRNGRPQRLVSLDVFRGSTIAAMTLVNEPGTWSALYVPLAHAEWNGVTPADWIFPFFLFIVGVSISLSLRDRIRGKTKGRIYCKIFRRAFLLFGLGVVLEMFPFYNIWTATWFDPSTLRIMGVLQRIAICYFAASIIFLHTTWKDQAILALGILVVYWALMTLINVPGCEITTLSDRSCNLASYLDRTILGTSHIWAQSKIFDPEGLLPTLPAIATTLLGVLTGHWLRSPHRGDKKVLGMLGAGIIFIFLGWLWSFWFPLNKSLWTSSYVVLTAGLALCCIAVCYWLVDLKGYRKWSAPFLIFGSNAIALYVGSTLIGKSLEAVEFAAPNDSVINLQEKIFTTLFLPVASPESASLLYAVTFVLISLVLLWPLYKWKIFLKI